ncbi:hypothetical protein FLJC2902T_10460 [Flavobacterium limnosediminis JC2902]|uniref:Uncharacterized protein n=1 Tax=Flavobacterium limnosediminis JC2902 TaxID=1341181 RepID=V6SS45_9FLAO|nr:hypothetical protein FLJC2902T_10460 [Flavobacterium limnosediminis JC2902]
MLPGLLPGAFFLLFLPNKKASDFYIRRFFNIIFQLLINNFSI